MNSKAFREYQDSEEIDAAAILEIIVDEDEAEDELEGAAQVQAPAAAPQTAPKRAAPVRSGHSSSAECWSLTPPRGSGSNPDGILPRVSFEKLPRNVKLRNTAT